MNTRLQQSVHSRKGHSVTLAGRRGVGAALFAAVSAALLTLAISANAAVHQPLAGGITGPSWVSGPAGNHNETMLRDSAPPTLLGGFLQWLTAAACPSWLCGAGGNHNETMVQDVAIER